MFSDQSLFDRYLALRPGRDTAEVVEGLWPHYHPALLEIRRCTAVYAGNGSPLTQVNGFGLDHSDICTLERIKDFYRGRADAFELLLGPFSSPEAWNLAFQQGGTLDHFEAVLHRGTADVPAVQCEAEIVEVGPGEVDEWTRVASASFFGDDQSEMAQSVAALMKAYTSSRRFLAMVDGKPAGAASLFIRNGAVFLGGAGTLSEFRGRGIQQALIAARLRAASDCDVAFVETEPGSSSQRNAERMGFSLCFDVASVMIKP